MTDWSQLVGWVEISRFLGLAPRRLYGLVARSDDLYVDIEVGGAGGTTRPISIPYTELKGVQRLIYRRILAELPVHSIAAAYKPGSSVVAAARVHRGPSTDVLRVDIRRFFPSITVRRVFGFLVARGFTPRASYILSSLMCHNACLPQGAPTSPAVSNCLCYGMDHELEAVARARDLRVTRYSDDVIFSGAILGDFNIERLCEIVRGIFNRHGFQMNHTKTRFMKRGGPQKVLGLLVDGKDVRLTRSMRRTIRAAFHKAGQNPNWGTEHLPQLRGYAEFYKCIHGRDATYQDYRATLRAVSSIKAHEVFHL